VWRGEGRRECRSCVWRGGGCRGYRGRVWRDEGHQGHAWCGRRHQAHVRCDDWHRNRRWCKRLRRHRRSQSRWCTRSTCWKRKNRNRRLHHQVRKHGLNVRIRSGCGGGKGEVRLVKHNMSGYKNPTRREIVAAVPLMVRGVTKEHTTGRARCELMRSSGSKVRVASAPEDTKVGVVGGVPKRAW
jgi:hypothetical protein